MDKFDFQYFFFIFFKEMSKVACVATPPEQFLKAKLKRQHGYLSWHIGMMQLFQGLSDETFKARPCFASLFKEHKELQL